jgi:uncharacterized membrane protein YccC
MAYLGVMYLDANCLSQFIMKNIGVYIRQNHPVALITAIKMCAAGLFGFLITNYFHFPESVWCLVTIAAVTQTGLDQTVIKSLMRAIGTIIGAVLGYWIAVIAKADPIIIITLIFATIFITSYIAVQPTVYSYCGIITGMTIAIVVFFNLNNENYFNVAVDRTYEVLLGVAILCVLNLLLYFFVKRYIPRGISKANISWTLPQFKMTGQYAIPALKVAFACVLTFLIWYYFKQPQGYWATISCLLIMEENQRATLKKGGFRFLAHFIATLVGLLCVLVLLHAPYAWRLLPLLITFFACGFLIGTKSEYAGMGNTLGIAIAIMLLSSPNAHETIQIIFERFYNVMIGITVAFLML